MKRIALVGVGWHARRIYVPRLRSTAAHRWVGAEDLVSAERAIRGHLDRDDVALVFSPTSPEQPPAPSVLRQLARMQDAVLAEVAAGSALREHDRTIALLAGLFDAMAADGGVVEIPWDARDRVPDL